MMRFFYEGTGDQFILDLMYWKNKHLSTEMNLIKTEGYTKTKARVSCGPHPP